MRHLVGQDYGAVGILAGHLGDGVPLVIVAVRGHGHDAGNRCIEATQAGGAAAALEGGGHYRGHIHGKALFPRHFSQHARGFAIALALA